MATSKDFIVYLQDALARVRGLSFRAMFGEYAMYANDVVVGLVCDQTVYIKVTEGTSVLLSKRVQFGHPFKGAKPAFMLTEGEIEDDELMAQVIAAALRDLPVKSKPSKNKALRKKPASPFAKAAVASKRTLARKK
jgi:TfoX/Sxy family transcriptional regulator of competence genes